MQPTGKLPRVELSIRKSSNISEAVVQGHVSPLHLLLSIGGNGKLRPGASDL